MPNTELPPLYLSDTLVSDLFLLEHLPQLAVQPLKLYLLLLLNQARHWDFGEEAYCARLGFDRASYQRALLQLADSGLIRLDAEGRFLELVDLKQETIRLLLAPDAPSTATAYREKLSDDFIRQMSDTFFAGRMTLNWTHFIESLFAQYEFEPQVIYLLLKEATDAGLLTMAYIKRIALRWHQDGIKCFEDVARDKEKRSKENEFVYIMEQQLRRRLTEEEVQMVRNWHRIYGYREDVLHYLLKKSPELRNASRLATYDRIVQNWYQAGCLTLEAIQAHEESRRRGARRPASSFDERITENNPEADRAYLKHLLQQAKGAQADG